MSKCIELNGREAFTVAGGGLGEYAKCTTIYALDSDFCKDCTILYDLSAYTCAKCSFWGTSPYWCWMTS